MSRQNLLKSGYVTIDNSQVRVIDSNDRIAQQMGSQAQVQDVSGGVIHPYVPESFSEDETDDDTVARLFGEETEQPQLMESSLPDEDEYADSNAQAMAEEILADANARAAQILEHAQDMADQQAREAYDKARQQGMQDGYQEGFEKAHAESEALKAQLAAQEIALKEEYQEKLDEMEPFLVEELTGVYEHIFGVDLSEHRSVLTHLIANTLHSVENVESYLVHVSSQDFSYVSMQKPQIMEEGCTGKAAVEIIEDITLGKNECLIETENGIFDCSLSVQLGELKRKLKLLSYHGNGQLLNEI